MNEKKGWVIRIRALRWRAFCFNCPPKYSPVVNDYVPASFDYPSQDIAMTAVAKHMREFHNGQA